MLDNCEHLIARRRRPRRRAARRLPGAADPRHQPRAARDRRARALRRRSPAARRGAPGGAAVRRPRARRPAPASPSTTHVARARSAAAWTACRWRSSSPPRGCARCRVEQIAARLDDRFRLLTGGSRAALPRHRTLRAVVDWSWEPARASPSGALARRLAVFSAGADRGERGRRLRRAATCSTGSPRWSTARCCRSSPAATRRATGCSRRSASTALEKLAEAGELEATRTAHARYFAALAERGRAASCAGTSSASGSRRLQAEHDDLIAALRWFGDAGDARAALRLTVSLLWFWLLSGSDRGGPHVARVRGRRARARPIRSTG